MIIHFFLNFTCQKKGKNPSQYASQLGGWLLVARPFVQHGLSSNQISGGSLHFIILWPAKNKRFMPPARRLCCLFSFLGDAPGMSTLPIGSPAGMAVFLKSLFFGFLSGSQQGFRVVGLVRTVDVTCSPFGNGPPKNVRGRRFKPCWSHGLRIGASQAWWWATGRPLLAANRDGDGRQELDSCGGSWNAD